MIDFKYSTAKKILGFMEFEKFYTLHSLALHTSITYCHMHRLMPSLVKEGFVKKLDIEGKRFARCRKNSAVYMKLRNI